MVWKMSAYDSLLVIAGAQRAGTSFALDALIKCGCFSTDQIPGGKEPRYFLGENSPPALGDPRHVGVFIDKSTSYINHPRTFDSAVLSSKKLEWVFLLRSPIMRAISHYLFSKANGLEHLEPEEALVFDFGEATRPYPEQISTYPFGYIRGSSYSQLLPKFLERRVGVSPLIFTSESIWNSPDVFLGSVHEAFGLVPCRVSASFEPRNAGRLNLEEKQMQQIRDNAKLRDWHSNEIQWVNENLSVEVGNYWLHL
jgi:hypothetical protein